jgi:DNA-directed RNA polymerase
MECIKNLFDRAHNIKKWLIDCAGIISDTNNPVSWITPIGVPVIQPYRVESETDQVRTAMHTIVVNKHNSKLPINKLRQKSAFPPNFVHSLDSTHMMYTAEQCYLEGITFAAVHDSYWTHAASVERMNVILREQFIRLHKEPLLENLRESFQRRYPDKNFPPIPARVQICLTIGLVRSRPDQAESVLLLLTNGAYILNIAARIMRCYYQPNRSTRTLMLSFEPFFLA